MCCCVCVYNNVYIGKWYIRKKTIFILRVNLNMRIMILFAVLVAISAYNEDLYGSRQSVNVENWKPFLLTSSSARGNGRVDGWMTDCHTVDLFICSQRCARFEKENADAMTNLSKWRAKCLLYVFKHSQRVAHLIAHYHDNERVCGWRRRWLCNLFVYIYYLYILANIFCWWYNKTAENNY